MNILKNLVALFILVLIFLFAFVMVTDAFAKASAAEVFFSFFGGLALLVGIIFPFAYFQNKKDRARKETNDEYGRKIWLAAEAKRQAGN